jgi:hypothetical protein
MNRVCFGKVEVLLVACLGMLPAVCLSAVENDDVRAVAERFVRQIEEGDTSAILQSYPMTEEFRIGMPNADTVTGWASGIEQLFGRLGDIANQEIVEHHEQGLRSVYLYYQGTKRPAKIWVTFRGEVIAGFHYDIWAEGYTEREPTLERSVLRIIEWLLAEVSLTVAIVLFALLPFVIIITIFLGQKEPVVNIDTRIEIRCIWGVKVDFAEIADISLMEDKISSIDITIRTFGYNCLNTYKGYFLSNRYGSVLLFTRTNSSPTIHIKREGKADIFLNFSNNEKTRTLYNEMKTAFAK